MTKTNERDLMNNTPSLLGKLLRYCSAFRQDPIDFVVVGAQKAGTTTLDGILRQHPSISMPDTKELHFFDKEQRIVLDSLTLLKYHRSWPPLSRWKLRGECTPSYIFIPGCLELIAKYRSDIKIVVILRNPVERAYSHWKMSRRSGVEPLTFSEAIIAEEGRLANASGSELRNFSYLSRSRYAQQIRRCHEIFGRDQVHFLRLETLLSEPELIYKRLFSHLGVPTNINIEVPHRNRGDTTRIPEDERRFVSEFLIEDMKEALNLLSWEVGPWCSEFDT